MRNHRSGRDSLASVAIMVDFIVIVVFLAGARTAQAQPSPPTIEPEIGRIGLCNPTSVRCDVADTWSMTRTGPLRWQAEADSRSHWLIGAIGGFVVGATATYFVLHGGGSTSKCDRDANQDALNRGECAGLVALGGLVGAGAGAFIGSRFRSDAVRIGSVRGLDIGRMPDGLITVARKWVH